MVSRVDVQASRTEVCITKVALYTHLVLVLGDLQHPRVFFRAFGVDDGRGERDGAKNSRLGGCQGGEGCATATDCEGWETMETNHRAHGRHGMSVQRLAMALFNVLT